MRDTPDSSQRPGVAAGGTGADEPSGIVSRPLRRIAGQSGWLLSGQLAQGALALVQAIVLTRALGVRGYGLFVLVIVSVTAVVQLLDSRVWEALTRYVPLFRARVILRFLYRLNNFDSE